MSETKIDLPVTISMTLDDFIDKLSDLVHDELFELVTKLDKQAAEWEFTLRLCDYFAKQRRLFDEEADPDVRRRVEEARKVAEVAEQTKARRRSKR